ncbi:DUF1236 domain-containing protein [Pararhizobium sp. BT-229]|uniref:DUF1236 domain-containing protein n=1 Tax=Pararhizobium sp. BT-229 TaxID=2986923 RepID=UPI0021F7324B|nr:DUF1236 domain-containing protein [Pararhizobium sp. BT-229]MCV9966822.1 DUF1236 domain-containing protein [Pararhizobium sp. BT-229]
MKTKTLAALAALLISLIPIGIMSAAEQEAPILPKKGAAQSGDQSGGTATQQPDADGTSSNGAGMSGGQEAKQPSDSDGSSPGDSPGASTDSSSTESTPQPEDETQPDSSSEDGSDSSGSSTPKPGQSSTESQTGDSQDLGTSSKTGEAQKSGDAAKSSSGSTETQSDTTTNVNISVEQKTEIREVVKEFRVEPVREVDFTVSVGTGIPRKITLEPLPQRIVEIVPQYAGYRFFILADGRIVIVDPAAYTIVYIINV